MSGGFAQRLIKHCPQKQCRQRKIQPDEEGDNCPDRAVNHRIIPHVVYIIREKYGIQHPEGCRKQRPGKNIPPLRRLTRRKIIHCRCQQNQRKAHGKETRLCPEGDKFHRNRQKLRHIVQNRVPDNHQKQHCRNQKRNEYCRK